MAGIGSAIAASSEERLPPSGLRVPQMQIRVPQVEVEALRDRLRRARWPDEIEGSGWAYGTNLSYLRDICGYWAHGFDWRRQEALLNSFANYSAMVDGIQLHYVLEPGRGPSPMPLVLFHGWPGTFHQLLKLVPLLSDPVAHGGAGTDSFDVIIPSLPGYGFSSRPSEPGWMQARFARVFAKLMADVLGYRRFGAHGGDIGAGVVNQLALHHYHLLAGIHLTNVARPYLGPGARPLSAAEQALLEHENRWTEEEGAYASLQRTRPQSVAYGLNDSPVGLAAWILEKWRAWSDCGGDLESVFTRDDLLTNLSIYWFTQTIGSSMRVYYEHRQRSEPLGRNDRIDVPTGIALFPRDLSYPPREWAERTYNVASWTEMPRGGHFPAMEQPELLARDIRTFFQRLR